MYIILLQMFISAGTDLSDSRTIPGYECRQSNTKNNQMNVFFPPGFNERCKEKYIIINIRYLRY